MHLTFAPELVGFRALVRAFFETDFPKDILARTAAGASLTTAEVRRSEQALASRGWLAASWPSEHGGPGWSLAQQYIFDEELERAGVPTVTPMGVVYVGPVIYTFGTPDQKARFLPGIRDGSTGWAQGYSEPEAGSDLAALQFRAERTHKDGVAGYLCNGSKIWTSAAQHADWIFLLARTSKEARKQEGITFLCAPMTDPGIRVVPIVTIDSKHVLNRVDFTDVFVPEDQRIGEEGKGWTYSTYLLGHERTSYARIGGKRRMLHQVRAIAAAMPTGGNTRLIDEEAFARKLSAAEIAVDGLEMTVLRILSAVSDGGTPGNEASVVKVLATETHQQITELFLEAAADHGLRAFPDAISPAWTGSAAFAAPAVAGYLGGRAQSIYGGTNDIQKNIMARRVLGL